MKTEQIFQEINAERERQNQKWGEQNHSPIHWMAILMEEVGEAAKEATDLHFKNPWKDDRGIKRIVIDDFDEIQHTRRENYRAELIQVASVAVQMIECIDRNYFNLLEQ